MWTNIEECDSQETMIIENVYPKYFDRSRRKSGHRLAHAPLHFCICDILCGHVTAVRRSRQCSFVTFYDLWFYFIFVKFPLIWLFLWQSFVIYPTFIYALQSQGLEFQVKNYGKLKWIPTLWQINTTVVKSISIFTISFSI